MFGRILFGALLAAVLMFGWGFVYWGVLNVSGEIMAPLPAAESVVATLREAGAKTGMYVYPMPADMSAPGAQDQFTELHRLGPKMQIAYVAEGSEPMDPVMMAAGFLQLFAYALLTGMLLAMARNALPGYLSRVVFVLLVGLIGVAWMTWGDRIWWFHSTEYAVGVTIYEMTAALLMGLVLAILIKPTPEQKTVRA